MKKLWWLMFGRAYLRGYKAGLCDGEMAGLEKQIAACERDELRALVAIGARHDGADIGQRPQLTLH